MEPAVTTSIARIAIATPESDARIRAEQHAAAQQAFRDNQPRTACPHDPQSLIARWWFEGYDLPKSLNQKPSVLVSTNKRPAK